MIAGRKHSMHRVIQHDALAAGILNSDYTGGTAQFATWKDELCNNDALLTTISKRLDSDYKSLNPKMRKPVALRDLETWINLDQEQHTFCHTCLLISSTANDFSQSSPTSSKELLQRTCAVYFACKAEFKKQVPTAFFQAEIERIEKGILGCAMLSWTNLSSGKFASCECFISVLQGSCANTVMQSSKHWWNRPSLHVIFPEYRCSMLLWPSMRRRRNCSNINALSQHVMTKLDMQPQY